MANSDGVRRQDRDEYEALWRDHAAGMVELRRHVDALAVDTRLRIVELVEAGKRTDARLKALGEVTDARIAALVSAVGQHIQQGRPQQ